MLTTFRYLICIQFLGSFEVSIEATYITVAISAGIHNSYCYMYVVHMSIVNHDAYTITSHIALLTSS